MVAVSTGLPHISHAGVPGCSDHNEEPNPEKLGPSTIELVKTSLQQFEHEKITDHSIVCLDTGETAKADSVSGDIIGNTAKDAAERAEKARIDALEAQARLEKQRRLLEEANVRLQEAERLNAEAHKRARPVRDEDCTLM